MRVGTLIRIIFSVQDNKGLVKFYLISFALLIIFSIIILILVLLRNHGDKTGFIINTVVYVCEYKPTIVHI